MGGKVPVSSFVTKNSTEKGDEEPVYLPRTPLPPLYTVVS
jgi:hypothetical protein